MGLFGQIQPSDIDTDRIWHDHLYGGGPKIPTPPQWITGTPGQVALMAIEVCQIIGCWVEVSSSEITKKTGGAYSPAFIQDGMFLLQKKRAICSGRSGIKFTKSAIEMLHRRWPA